MSTLVFPLGRPKIDHAVQRAKASGVLSAVATTACRDQLLTRSFPSPRSSSARARRGVRTLEGAQGLNSPGR